MAKCGHTYIHAYMHTYIHHQFRDMEGIRGKEVLDADHSYILEMPLNIHVLENDIQHFEDTRI